MFITVVGEATYSLICNLCSSQFLEIKTYLRRISEVSYESSWTTVVVRNCGTARDQIVSLTLHAPGSLAGANCQNSNVMYSTRR